MKKTISFLVLAAVIPAAFMAGCGPSSNPTSNPPIATAATATTTQTPTGTLVPHTATYTLTVTATNTATNTLTPTQSVPPTSSSTSTQTATLTNTATSTATITPTVQPTSPATVPLGAVATYVILSSSSITNTGATTVCSGLVGENPGTSTTGYTTVSDYMECGGVNITPDYGTNTAGTAETDLTTAYNNASGRTPTVLANAELGGLTLTPGVYGSVPSLDITGTLTLDGTGYTNGGVFIFQTGGILTTAAASNIVLAGGAKAANIFWQVGNYASLGASSSFEGNIMSATYVALGMGTLLDGRALSKTSYVSLLSDAISIQ